MLCNKSNIQKSMFLLNYLDLNKIKITKKYVQIYDGIGQS